MRVSHFFIDRPIFAGVLSLLITILGAFAYFTLAVAQYPEVAPPTLQVTASYPGASADVVSETVATPLEQQINGIENLKYFSSQSTGDGKLTLTLTFKLGTDLNTALVLTQSRVLIAQPRLPQIVQQLGVTVKKVASDYVIVPHLYSPDGSRDQLYLSNYATLHIKDAIARLDGVGDVQTFGARDYATASTLISCFVSLTLSPALCGVLLRPHEKHHASQRHFLLTRPILGFFSAFNRSFEWLSQRFGRLTGRLIRLSVVVIVAYAGLTGLAAWQFSRAPTGFIPDLDQDYLITVLQLPPGSSLARTDE